MLTYKVNNIFDSIQGEGADTGVPVTFVRFATCNLTCKFCDTDFSKFSELTAKQIINKCGYYVVFTGGEPLLQNLKPITDAMGRRIIGIETNGTLPIPNYLWERNVRVSLSPKVSRNKCPIVDEMVSSLKILYPYLRGVRADDWNDFMTEYRSLQVIDPEKGENIKGAIKEVQRLGYPWKLGIQIHKFLKGVK